MSVKANSAVIFTIFVRFTQNFLDIFVRIMYKRFGMSLLHRVVHAIYFWTTPLGLRPDGQPGPLPIDGVVSSLLIELEARIL